MQVFTTTVDQQSYPVLDLPGRPKALLDVTLAAIYGVETRYVKRAVKNNPSRFPSVQIIRFFTALESTGITHREDYEEMILVDRQIIMAINNGLEELKLAYRKQMKEFAKQITSLDARLSTLESNLNHNSFHEDRPYMDFVLFFVYFSRCKMSIDFTTVLDQCPRKETMSWNSLPSFNFGSNSGGGRN